ncbi:uncharacterized protein J7T54_003650 [Emericellopsis cladophorae]|uniref:Uncharacterized protein n=1 Tax=Emericellopsis cladophorae TaxID=2686198 RepID=A0A9P9Y357_9HYPO|nr:uncharacterized protein J7T54_003650 [Emericellopsis cladophorae]KAI6782637.1 hypothetical protein J7T54_003650 [Emericellopsis cladophorae]
MAQPVDFVAEQLFDGCTDKKKAQQAVHMTYLLAEIHYRDTRQWQDKAHGLLKRGKELETRLSEPEENLDKAEAEIHPNAQTLRDLATDVRDSANEKTNTRLEAIERLVASLLENDVEAVQARAHDDNTGFRASASAHPTVKRKPNSEITDSAKRHRSDAFSVPNQPVELVGSEEQGGVRLDDDPRTTDLQQRKSLFGNPEEEEEVLKISQTAKIGGDDTRDYSSFCKNVGTDKGGVSHHVVDSIPLKEFHSIRMAYFLKGQDEGVDDYNMFEQALEQIDTSQLLKSVNLMANRIAAETMAMNAGALPFGQTVPFDTYYAKVRESIFKRLSTLPTNCELPNLMENPAAGMLTLEEASKLAFESGEVVYEELA